MLQHSCQLKARPRFVSYMLRHCNILEKYCIQGFEINIHGPESSLRTDSCSASQETYYLYGTWMFTRTCHCDGELEEFSSHRFLKFHSNFTIPSRPVFFRRFIPYSFWLIFCMNYLFLLCATCSISSCISSLIWSECPVLLIKLFFWKCECQIQVLVTSSVQDVPKWFIMRDVLETWKVACVKLSTYPNACICLWPKIILI